MNLGSARIWIYNLFDNFKKLGVQVYLNDWNNYEKYDLAVFGKDTFYKDLIRAKSKNPKIICGIINPSDEKNFKSFFLNFQEKKKIKVCDFFIVGSVEEKAYYNKYCKNVFIYPLIEKLYTRIKKHDTKKKIILSYHGNLDHLKQFQYGLKEALENLYKEFDLELRVYYNLKLGKWRTGRPRIPVVIKSWDINHIEKDLLESDIGLAPSVNTSNSLKNKFLIYFTKLIFFSQKNYNNDYILRFKNNTNGGRAFVYFQLGIPVVSGFNLQCFNVIGNNEAGFFAHSEESWYLSIKNLIEDVNLRKKMSILAKKKFDEEYDEDKWSKIIYDQLSYLYNSKKKVNDIL